MFKKIKKKNLRILLTIVYPKRISPWRQYIDQISNEKLFKTNQSTIDIVDPDAARPRSSPTIRFARIAFAIEN